MKNPSELARRNRRLAGTAFALVFAMVGVSFAAVPLYAVFCRVTGYNGTPQIGPTAERPAVGEQVMTVRFNANTQPDLPWRFEPAVNSVRVQVGEQAVAFYNASSTAERPTTGVAVYNVTPEVVGKYFHKTACFCFDEQTLTPGQHVDMPVAFWVDPAIGQDPNTRNIRTITLSYTFFRSLNDADRAGALADAGPHVGRAQIATP